MTTLLTAYISRASLLPYQGKSPSDQLVMIFTDTDPQIFAGWSNPSSESLNVRDLPWIQSLRLLYSLEARNSLQLPPPHGLGPPPSGKPTKQGAAKHPRSYLTIRLVRVETRLQAIETMLHDIRDELAMKKAGIEESKSVV